MVSVSGLGERYPIWTWKSEYKQQVAILREIVGEHESNLVLGEPQLNWCDSAVMVSFTYLLLSIQCINFSLVVEFTLLNTST